MYFPFAVEYPAAFAAALSVSLALIASIVTAGQRDVALFHEILHAELVGIHADLARDAIHVRLRGEESLRLAGRAHLPAGKIVRVDARDRNARVLGAVAAARMSDAADHRARPESAVGAGVEISVHLMGNDRAVALDAGLQFHDRRVPRRAGKKFFAVFHDHLDRPPRCAARANSRSARRWARLCRRSRRRWPPGFTRIFSLGMPKACAMLSFKPCGTLLGDHICTRS